MNTQARRTDQRRSVDSRNKRKSEIILIGTQRYSDAPEEDGDSRTVRKTSYYSRYHYCKLTCAFILFTILSMVAGIIIVRLTASTKNNTKCIQSFKQTTRSKAAYDSIPKHVAVGDFNHDNLLDLVIANSGIDNIGIRLVSSTGTFGNQTFYSTGKGSQPCWVAVQDFNNDHRLDIAVANYGTHSIGIFLADDHGNFLNQEIFFLNASRPLSLAIGDFNNDNQWDIAVVNNGTFNLTILFGFGNGSFQIRLLYHMGYDSMPCSIAVADLNHDNRSDIVVVNNGTSEFVVFLSTGNETVPFSIDRYSTGANSHPSSITLNYFNDDHYMDVAVVNSATQNVGVFIGSNNGAFIFMGKYSTGSYSYPVFIASGLLNNDTKYDLIVADSGQNNLIIFEGQANGSFSISTNQSTGSYSDPCSIVIADFNNNNQSVAVVVNRGINSILVFTNYTSHTTANETVYSTGGGIHSSPYFVTVGNFSNDTYLDIIVVNTYTHSMSVFLGLGDGTFQNPEIVYMIYDDDYSYSLGVGDFNNDKQVDIALTIPNWDEIDIYFGQGNGSFKYKKTYNLNTDSYPSSITVADFNNDQNLDIATANYDTNNVAVLLGSNTGKFSNAVYYDLTEFDESPIFVTVGDFNKDRFKDIVSANYDTTTISILLGNGNGTFQDAISIDTNGSYPTWLVIGDLNNDKNQDIVFVSPESSIMGIFRGYGNGNFSGPQIYSTDKDAYPNSVALGDFNTDKMTDIAVANAIGSSITIFYGTKTNDFIKQNSIYLEVSSGPNSIAVGDFNNDNEDDIVVANVETNDISVLILKYQSAFEHRTSYQQGSAQHPFSIIADDFNDDNQLDIVVANSGQGNIEILVDYYNGTFMKTITSATGDNSYPRYVVTADFNRDNQLDIAVANNRNHTLMIILNSGNQTFNTSLLYSTGAGSFPSSVATGDFNKDGWTDIVVTNSRTDNVGVFLGYNYPTFTTNYYYQCPRGSFPFDVVADDFNGDNELDLLVIYKNINTEGILFGNGNGTFEMQLFPHDIAVLNITSFAIGNFNNDTLLDIAFALLEYSEIYILFGYDNGTFSENVRTLATSFNSSFIEVGYFNKDDIQDLVVMNSDNDYIGIFLGYGNGSFTNEILYPLPAGSSPVLIVVGNFNNDKISDLVAVNSNGNSITILLGNGNGSFEISTSYSTGNRSTPSSIAIADLDNDTYIDIVVANTGSGNIAIFFGYGNGKFRSPIIYEARPDAVLKSIIVADINNDTILDIAVADFGYGSIGVFYGLGNRTFLIPKAYFNRYPSEIFSFVINDFNNDGRLDFAVAISRKDKIGIMLQNNKTEPFGQYNPFSTGIGSTPSAVAVQDLDKDGQLDIAVANYKANNICILFGYGNGSFMNCQTYPTGLYSVPNSITIGDVDGDQTYDIIVTNSNRSEINIFFGYRNRTFTIIKPYSTGYGSQPYFTSIADLNRDNITDIVVADYGTNSVLIFYGSGNRTFLRLESYSFNYDYRPTSVAIGDFNNDTWLDIGVANYGSDHIDILLHSC